MADDVPLTETPWYQRAWNTAVGASNALPTVNYGREAAQEMANPRPPLDAAEVAAGAADIKLRPNLTSQSSDELRALGGSAPQGPVGPDGFPTYKDPSSMGAEAAAPPVPAGPMRTIPAHWQPGSRSETRQYGMAPDELQSGQYHRDTGAGQALIAADKDLEAAQQQGMADAVYAASHAAASKTAADHMQRIETQRAAYVEQEKAKLNTMAVAAQEKVDLSAAQGGAIGSLFGAIAAGLGQFGASLSGGPNTALNVINANIDRRIAEQQRNIDNAGRALDRETNLYKDNLAEFGDKQRAVLATKVAYLDQAKAMADQQYALAKNTANEGAYHNIVAGIEAKRAQAADDFAKLTHTQVATQGNEHYVPTQQVGGAGAGAGVKGKDDQYVPTLGGYAGSKEDAAKLNLKGALRMQMNENMRQINAKLEEAKGLNSATSPLKLRQIDEQIDGLVNETLQTSNVMAGQGAMSEGDKAVTAAARNLKNARAQFRTNDNIARTQENIKAAAERQLIAHRLEGEAYGIQLGTQGYMRDAAGNVVPVQKLTGQTKTVTKKTEGVPDLIEPPKGKSAR